MYYLILSQVPILFYLLNIHRYIIVINNDHNYITTTSFPVEYLDIGANIFSNLYTRISINKILLSLCINRSTTFGSDIKWQNGIFQ